EVVHDVKVGPTVTVVISPTTAETVARVVPVEPGLGGPISKRAIAVIPHQEIRRTVFCVVVRQWVSILASALIVGIEAKIDVEPSVAIVVRDRGPGEGSLWRGSELKRIRLVPELAAAIVHKQDRTAGGHENDFLAAVVVVVGEQRAHRVVQNA